MSQNFWSTSIPLVAKNSPFPSKIPWNLRVVSLSCLYIHIPPFHIPALTQSLHLFKKAPPTSVNPVFPCYSHIALPIQNPSSRMGFYRYCGCRWSQVVLGPPPPPPWHHLGFWFVHHFGGRRLFTWTWRGMDWRYLASPRGHGGKNPVAKGIDWLAESRGKPIDLCT